MHEDRSSENKKLYEVVKWSEYVLQRQRGMLWYIKLSVFLWTFLKVLTTLKRGQRKGQKIIKD